MTKILFIRPPVLRNYCLILIFSLVAFSALGQKTEIGLMGGMSNYYGDLNTNLSLRHVHPAGSIFLRNNFGLRTAVKTSFSYGRIEAWDSDSKQEYYRQRNLSFRSDLMELSCQFEFNFFKYWHGAQNKKFRFSPYIATGFSLFYFNPKTLYQGRWIELQPLGTEGQNSPEFTGRKKYSLLSTAIPIVGGIKWNLDSHWSLGVEGGVRKSFTDYIDDVSSTYVSPIYLPSGQSRLSQAMSDRSVELGIDGVGKPGQQRGDNHKKDDYFLFGIQISYTIITSKCPPPGERGK